MAVSAGRAVKYFQSLGVDCKDAKVIDLRARASLSLASKFSAVTAIADGEVVAVCGYLGQCTDPAELAHDARTLSEVLDAKIVLALKSVEKPIADALRQEKVNFLVLGRLANIPPKVVLLPDGAYAAEAPELFKKLLPWTQVVLLNHLLKDGAERRPTNAPIRGGFMLYYHCSFGYPPSDSELLQGVSPSAEPSPQGWIQGVWLQRCGESQSRLTRKNAAKQSLDERI